MHDIEPFYFWRELYVSSEDNRSPFYGRHHSEFTFTNKIYNYFIHPQWDDIGSNTLYVKLIYTDYEIGFCVVELIGEWNDCLYNDIMYLKENLINPLINEGIHKFIFICENVLNFHGSDDCYYEEWYEDVSDEFGWICFINLLQHVEEEMISTHIQSYIHFFNDINWRKHKPNNLVEVMEHLMSGKTMELY